MFYTLEALCNKLNFNLKNSRVVIQGFGNVGGSIAEILYNKGAKIIAISDITGGLYHKDGLNIEDLLKWRDKNCYLKDFNNSIYKFISNEDLLTIKCDILIPAAIENQINQLNADYISCKIVLEGANGPTTPKADEILNQNGIIVVPDILANAGGVCVSYFEYIQDIHSYFWSIDRINKELQKILVKAFEDVYKLSKERNFTFRTAAYVIAISRLAKAYELRGIFP